MKKIPQVLDQNGLWTLSHRLLAKLPEKAKAVETRKDFVNAATKDKHESFQWRKLPRYFELDTDEDEMPMEPAKILEWGMQYIYKALDEWIEELSLSPDSRHIFGIIVRPSSFSA